MWARELLLLLAGWRTDGVLQVSKSQHPPAELPKTISWRQPFLLKAQLGGAVWNGRYRGNKILLRKASIQT